MFKAVLNAISQVLPILNESGSELSYFILDPINFAEVKILIDDIKKPWIKSTMKEIKNIINNQSFIAQDPYAKHWQ